MIIYQTLVNKAKTKGAVSLGLAMLKDKNVTQKHKNMAGEK